MYYITINTLIVSTCALIVHVEQHLHNIHTHTLTHPPHHTTARILENYADVLSLSANRIDNTTQTHADTNLWIFATVFDASESVLSIIQTSLHMRLLRLAQN